MIEKITPLTIQEILIVWVLISMVATFIVKVVKRIKKIKNTRSETDENVAPISAKEYMSRADNNVHAYDNQCVSDGLYIRAKRAEALGLDETTKGLANELYDLIGVEESDRQDILEAIEDEGYIINDELLDYGYIERQENGFCEKQDLTPDDFYKRYGLQTDFVDIIQTYSNDVNPYNVLLAVAHRALNKGKTICCMQSNELIFVIIDSRDRSKLLKLEKELVQRGEIYDLVMFDDVDQAFPVPVDIYDNIHYEFTPNQYRGWYDVQQTLIKLNVNKYSSLREIERYLSNKLPIFASVDIDLYIDEIFVSKTTLRGSYAGISLVDITYSLEQSISATNGINVDWLAVAKFEVVEFGGSSYRLFLRTL